jgi:GNAT superfamily N-acetyltransferase
MALRVRDATAADADAIGVVARAAWRDTYAGLLANSTIEAFVNAAYTVDRLERRIAAHTVLVAEDEGGIIAFADALPEADRLSLVAIYAEPERRGEGAGTFLLETLRTRYPDRPVVADVLTGNRKGEVFYERRGFVPREELVEDLFGEPAAERRWWLDATLDP